MREALKLARKGAGNTSPNPMVGAVVVAGDEIIGRGFHAHAGADHAEVVALREAGTRAQGATLYLTLEPCVHHGRTPPCSDTVIAARPGRVVVAMEDPDERMRGKGIAALRGAGITVEVGEGEAEARNLNRMYVRNRLAGRPYLTLKMAQTLDGRIARHAGEREQLTATRGQRLVRTLRYEHDAVMVGAGTVRIDDPQLTVRPYKQRHVGYVRIVVDARGMVSERARVFKQQAKAKTIVLTTAAMRPELQRSLSASGITVIVCDSGEQGEVDLHDAMRKLGESGLMSVLCEGGPTLAGSLLRANLVDELCLIVSPRIYGSEAVAVIDGAAPATTFELADARPLGPDLALVVHPAGA